MFPEVSQVLWACCVRGLIVAHTPVINRLQLSKVAHEYERDVTERAIVGIHAVLAEVCPSALLYADMHAVKERCADEGDLINNQQKYILPGVLDYIHDCEGLC